MMAKKMIYFRKSHDNQSALVKNELRKSQFSRGKWTSLGLCLQ